jgi:putative hydrolase of HD superfamily
MARLPSLLDFVKFTHAFRSVERILHYPHSDRVENDTEHSFQLALVAWYILDTEKLSLDKNLIIKYALVHDLVEAYAGDVFFYRDATQNEAKKAREKVALERIKKEFPTLTDIHKLIVQYEKQQDKESAFVYALDKLLPMINIYLSGGRTWKEKGTILSVALENKIPKIAISEDIQKYMDELIVILKREEHILFSKK